MKKLGQFFLYLYMWTQNLRVKRAKTVYRVIRNDELKQFMDIIAATGIFYREAINDNTTEKQRAIIRIKAAKELREFAKVLEDPIAK